MKHLITSLIIVGSLTGSVFGALLSDKHHQQGLKVPIAARHSMEWTIGLAKNDVIYEIDFQGKQFRVNSDGTAQSLHETDEAQSLEEMFEACPQGEVVTMKVYRDSLPKIFSFKYDGSKLHALGYAHTLVSPTRLDIVSLLKIRDSIQAQGQSFTQDL